MAHSYPEVTASQRGFGKIALLVVVMALIGNVVAFAYLRPYAILLKLGPLAEAREQIHMRYVGEVDDQALIDAALRGMADALGDANTQYFSKEELSAFEEHVAGHFTGIGAYVGEQDGYLLIINPFDDSPAMKAGLLPGDLILEVDGQDIQGMGIDMQVSMLKGKEGTTVDVKVRHPDGEGVEVTITRATITVPSVVGFRRDPGNGYEYMLDEQQKIAYVRLTQFGETSQQEVEDTLKQLKSQGMAALILDLRDNPGGLLEGAAGMANLFLTGGKTIVSTQGKGAMAEVLTSNNDTLLPDLPLVVLINENSASASEIVAGAMIDNDRALLVGSRTYGKGSVQQILYLDEDKTSAIKLTTAYWYMPSGKMIHRKPDAERWGVDPSPDCFVPMDAEQTLAMLIRRRDGEVEDAYANRTGPITPAWLREEMLDDPLAAALQAAQGKLATGNWPQVGVDAEAAFAKPTERERLEQRKQMLLEQMNQVDEQLERLPEETEERR